MELAPSGDQESRLPCQICKVQDPSFYCHQCPKLLCLQCKVKHGKVGAFKAHTVSSNLCSIHQDGITHICMHCVQPVCTQCMLTQHIEHEQHFVTYNEGIKQLKKKAETVYKNVTKKITDKDEEFKTKEAIDAEITETIETLDDQMAYLEENLQKARRLAAEAKTKRTESCDLGKAYTECRIECSSAAESAHNLVTSTDNFWDRYTEILDKAQQAADNLDKLSVSNLLLEFTAKKPCHCDIVIPRTATANIPWNYDDVIPQSAIAQDQSYYDVIPPRQAEETEANQAQGPPEPDLITNLTMSKIILDMKHTHDIKCGIQAACIDDDVLVVNDTKQRHVIRLSKQGTVIGRYDAAGKGKVKGVAVYNKTIYIAQSGGITLIPQYGPTAVYTPKVDNINKILVKDRNTIYISNNRLNGKIYRYQVDTNSTFVVAKGLNQPRYMSLERGKEGDLYVISEWGSHKVRVYNEHWKRVYKFGSLGDGNGQFDEVHATTVTSMNTLLIADYWNHRVSHYTVQGQLLSHIVTHKHGLKKPVAVAYNKPHLWVTCGDKGNIKCYLLK